MVICSTTPETAKTLSTLKHDLNLSQYANILILDDGGDRIWCQHEMVRLYHRYGVNIIFEQVSKFNVWDSVYRQFEHQAVHTIPTTQPHLAYHFYALIAKYQKKDKLFIQMYNFLEYLDQNISNIAAQRIDPAGARKLLWWQDVQKLTAEIVGFLSISVVFVLFISLLFPFIHAK